MRTIIVNVFVVLLIAVSKTTAVSPEAPYYHGLSNLRAELLQDYDAKTIPLVRYNHPVRVSVGLSLNNILDVDEDTGVIDFYGWVRADWRDPRLSFDNGVYGANETRLEVDKIWQPDLALFNSAEKDLLVLKDSKVEAIVFHSGLVLVVPPIKFKANCEFNRSHNGEPHHGNCFVKIGSWTHSVRDIDVQITSNFEGSENSFLMANQIDLSHYNPHRKWAIEALTTTRDEKIYPCCPDAYPSISFHFKLKHASEARNADNDSKR